MTKSMAQAAKRAISIPASGGEAGLNRYLAEIKKFPILAPEEEYMLAKRWTEHQDTDAAAKLVNSHLRLVAKIAMKRSATSTVVNSERTKYSIGNWNSDGLQGRMPAAEAASTRKVPIRLIWMASSNW